MGSTQAEVEEEMAAMAAAGKPLPKLVVFDLDYTLWPFWCDCMDSSDTPRLYPDSRPIIEALKSSGITMAIASRTPTPEVATVFLKKLGISDGYFVVKEMYPSWTHKTDHFLAIHKKLGVEYRDMLFFDDEARNTRTIEQLGVTCVLVDHGFNQKEFVKGLRDFAAARP